jgi:hypothetical protein
MLQLYRGDLKAIFQSWGTFAPEFGWLQSSVIYGLFLSDHEVLSAVEADLVILSSIMVQGMWGPSLWHLRGMRRLGASEEDAEQVQQAIETIAVWAGRSIEGWPRVADVPKPI